MVTSLQKSQPKQSDIQRKIKVEGNVNEGGGDRSPGHCKMGRIRISHGAMDKGLRTDLTEEMK
jgi:hypothetical protein